MEVTEFLRQAKSVFWDFDGVIKNSLTVKADAFEQLFLPFGKDVANQVKRHHEVNGGMSRYEKLPIYLKWAGRVSSGGIIDEFERNFSKLVKQKVIDAEWVTGVLEYLNSNNPRQNFYLVTATPQQEIEDILSALEITHFFNDVIGSPTRKSKAIRQLIHRDQIIPAQSVMIGDSIVDYNAAIKNEVPFILRKTDLNKNLQSELSCLMIRNFR